MSKVTGVLTPLHELDPSRFRYVGDSEIGGTGSIHKSVQYCVCCHLCDELEDYEAFRNQRWAEIEYRSRGWTKTKAGWQCAKH